MRRTQISSYCFWNVMLHAQKPDFVLLYLKYDDTCTETRFRLTVFEMWWHMRRNQISSYCVWNVMTHTQKPYFVLLCLKSDGTCAETRFRLSAKRTSPFKWVGVGRSVQSATDRRNVHISLQGLYCSCKPVFCTHVTLTGYPFHSLFSPSLLLPCVTVCHHISNAV
jgi:hypothetical protein